MKDIPFTILFRRALVAGVVIIGALTIVVLLFHIQGLSHRIAELEAQTTQLQTQVASFDRTLCSRNDRLLKKSAAKIHTLQSAGYTRSYQVNTPASYDSSVRYPVILSFDGIEGSGNRMRLYSHFDDLPAITVYLDALPGKRGFTAWQGAPYSVEGERDIQFVRQVLKTLPAQYCIDSTQIFAVGMSNGGAFATIVGCEIGNQIRAVASVSGAFYTTCKREERTPSLLVMHSSNDGQVPFMGEVNRRLPKVQQWVNEQAAERHCKTTVPSNTVNEVTYYNWQDCSDNSILRFVVMRNQAHGWLTVPSAPQDGIGTTADYIWKFFQDAVYYN